MTIAGERRREGGAPFLSRDEKCFPAEAGRENTKHSAEKRKTIDWKIEKRKRKRRKIIDVCGGERNECRAKIK